MKAILGNFKKISETEFHLKKDMQFAQVLLDVYVDTLNFLAILTSPHNNLLTIFLIR